METTTFDSFFTSGQLQMCKVLFPLLPPQLRGQFAIFIKMQELLNAINYVKLHPLGTFQGLQPPQSGEALIDSVLPYCNEEQKESLQHFRQSFQQMEQLKDMMDMVSMMKDLFPQGTDPQKMDPAQIADMMSVFSGGSPFPSKSEFTAASGDPSSGNGFPADSESPSSDHGFPADSESPSSDHGFPATFSKCSSKDEALHTETILQKRAAENKERKENSYPRLPFDYSLLPPLDN